jgi:hypothetical protein
LQEKVGKMKLVVKVKGNAKLAEYKAEEYIWAFEKGVLMVVAKSDKAEVAVIRIPYESIEYAAEMRT